MLICIQSAHAYKYAIPNNPNQNAANAMMCVETNKQPIPIPPPITLYQNHKITPRAPPRTASKPQRIEQRAKEENMMTTVQQHEKSTTTSIAKTKTKTP
jgi:hypothetical protein